MALQDCKECKAKVSSRSENCPKCGAPVESTLNAVKSVITLAAGGVACYFVIKAALHFISAGQMLQSM